MNDLNGREFFEAVYSDEMAIDPTHKFGDAQELDFEDASVREAAYAGWMLAMSCAHEHISNSRLALEKLRATVVGPVNKALDILETEQFSLTNFRYQLNRHEVRKQPGTQISVESLYDHESVVESKITSLKSVVAPCHSRSRIPPHILEANEHFNIGIVFEFDKYYPVGYTFSKLFMANGIGPAEKEYQQNVFVVLDIRGNADLYKQSYAESLSLAYAALGEFAKRCENICPVGDIRPLGDGSLHGGPVKALVLPLMIHHHEFQKVQKVHK